MTKTLINSSILVLSDIHASEGDPAASDAESYVSTSASSYAHRIDPFSNMVEIIKRDKSEVCCIVCPGDMTNKGSKSGIQFVFQKLREVARELSAASLVVIPGNHDLDSRYHANDYDARGQAMLIRPPFP